MRKSVRSHHFFDTRSVLLFAALTVGTAGVGMHARAADRASVAASEPQAQSAPPAAANPANRPPAMAAQKTPPPMTTSPAFGPAARAGGDGAAQNPDVRPEITATMPASAPSAFERADSNRDGQLSPSEAERLPAISARFEALDTNRDGMLSAQEFNVGVNN